MPGSSLDGNDLSVAGVTAGVISEGVAAVQAVGASAYSLVLNPLCDVYPVTVAANATGFIIPAPPAVLADIPQLQQITIINRDATHTITPDVKATSNVATGSGSALAALTAWTLIWDAATALWYHEG